RPRSRVRGDAPAFLRGRRDPSHHGDRVDERAQPRRHRDAARSGEEKLTSHTPPHGEERRAATRLEPFAKRASVLRDALASRVLLSMRGINYTSGIFVTCSSKAGREEIAAYQRSTLSNFGRSGTRSR